MKLRGSRRANKPRCGLFSRHYYSISHPIIQILSCCPLRRMIKSIPTRGERRCGNGNVRFWRHGVSGFLPVWRRVSDPVLSDLRPGDRAVHRDGCPGHPPVVAKRTEVSHHHHSGAGNAHYTTSSTWYYVTFQVESGDRLELPVSGREYGLLVEGDRGCLTFQGTRYLGFAQR